MKCTRIEEKNESYFMDLIPEELIDDRTLIKLGAVDDQGYACAGCAFGLDERVVNLKWLYTDPENRDMGAASVILSKIIEMSKELDLDGIVADFYSDSEAMDIFLEHRGFLVGMDNSIYRIPMEDIIGGNGREVFGKSDNSDGHIMVLSEREALKKLTELSIENDINPVAFSEMTPEHSLIRIDENGKPTGCILTHKNSDGEIKLDYLINTGAKSGAVELLGGLYDVLSGLESTDFYVSFREGASGVLPFVERLTGNSIDEYRMDGNMHAVILFD